jgi:hypothetical protein
VAGTWSQLTHGSTEFSGWARQNVKSKTLVGGFMPLTRRLRLRERALLHPI